MMFWPEQKRVRNTESRLREMVKDDVLAAAEASKILNQDQGRW